jgi:POTRA domain, FtsQ-type
MDYSDHSIGLPTNAVDGSPLAFPPFLRLVTPSSTDSSHPENPTEVGDSSDQNGSTVWSETPHVELVDQASVHALFGEVSDEAFPEVSANHPARSRQSHVGSSLNGITLLAEPTAQLVPGARAKRTLASLSNHPVSSPLDRQTDPFDPQAKQQAAPARSRSYERRQPGSVGGVRTRPRPAVAPTEAPRDYSTDRATDLAPGDIGQRPAKQPAIDLRSAAVELPQGVRVFRAERTNTSPNPDIVIDLRAAELGRAVHLRRVAGSPGPSSAASSIPATNYFNGHDYETAREIDRSSATIQPSGRTTRKSQKTQKTPRERRISYRSQLEARTGLSPRAISALSLGVLGLLGVGLLYSPVFSLHNVDVRRAGPAASRIRAAAHLRSGDPLIFLDVAQVQRRIAALPEISAARVERVWPRGVRITVTTRTPVAALSHAGRISLVAADATVLRDLDRTDAASVIDDEIIYVPIPVGALAPIGKQLTGASKRTLDLLAALDPDLRDRVVSVVVDGDDLHATFSSAGKARHLVVHFGDERELPIKARALGALLGAGSIVNVVGIDLTVPDAPVLRLAGTKVAS